MIYCRIPACLLQKQLDLLMERRELGTAQLVHARSVGVVPALIGSLRDVDRVQPQPCLCRPAP